MLIICIDDNRARSRHATQQMMKLDLDGFEIGKDIRMIIFEIVQDQQPRAIMKKFAALVEEGRIVFISLDHERPTLTQPCPHAKVLRNTTDQKAWLIAGRFEHPGQQARGCRLAVRSSHDARQPSPQNVLSHKLSAGGIGDVQIEHGLDLGIAAGKGVAHQHEIRSRDEVVRAERTHFDVHGRQNLRHGRISAGIRSGHPPAGCPGQAGDAGHGRTADTEDMKVTLLVHRVIAPQIISGF